MLLYKPPKVRLTERVINLGVLYTLFGSIKRRDGKGEKVHW